MKMLLTTACLATIICMSASRTEAQSPFTRENPFDLDGFDPPKRTKTVEPAYPSNARAGVVGLRVKIDPEGRVNAVSVVRDIEGATQAAVAAVAQWEYTPTKLNGEAVWVVMTVRVPSPWQDHVAAATFEASIAPSLAGMNGFAH